MTALVPRRLRSAVEDQLDCPARRGGYALVASTAITSVLGLGYWWLAARMYTEDEVGRGAALIAAMLLITEVSILGMGSGLVRFLPQAGGLTRDIIKKAYLTGVAIALVTAIVATRLLNNWIPSMEILDSPAAALWFIAATVVWVVFVLQDGALTGLGRAGVVPVENLLFSLGKIVLLLIFGLTIQGDSLILSWTIPAFVAVAAMTVLLFGNYALASSNPAAGSAISFSKMLSFSGKDHVATLMVRAAALVLPLIVVRNLGTEANSHYYVAFSTAYVLYLISSNIGSSLVAEAARVPHRLHLYTGRTLRQSLLLIVPSAIAMTIGAEFYLNLFGGGYSANGTTLLRLFAVAAIPNTITTIYIAVLRSQRRLGRVLGVQALLGLPTLLLAPFALSQGGLAGFGVLWLVVQVVVAMVVVVIGFWDVWAGTISSTALARVAAVRGVGQRFTRPADNPLRMLSNRTDRAVVGFRNADAGVVVKVARNSAGLARLEHESQRLEEIHSNPGLFELYRIVPKVVSTGEQDGRRFVTETLMPGTSAMVEFGPTTPQPLVVEALAYIAALHSATAVEVFVTNRRLARWLDERAAIVRDIIPPSEQDALDRLLVDVRAELEGSTVTAGWIHGDLSPANILTDHSGRLKALIDWEGCGTDELPDIDLIQLLLALRVAARSDELGQAVVDVLDNGWRTEEEELLAGSASPLNGHISTRSLLLLTWLRHVSGNLGRGNAHPRNRMWISRNVLPVLALAPPAPEVAAEPGPLRRAFTRLGQNPVAVMAAVSFALSMGLWGVSLGRVDLRAMSDIGLLSVLPVSFFAGLGLAVFTYLVVVEVAPELRVLRWAHLAGIAAMLHGTPAALYGTLRYSWSWKHVGVVDYIQRTGDLNPDIAFLDIYHSWPGLFGFTALLSDLSGVDAVTLAMWTPLFLTIGNLLALAVLFRAFTKDQRVIGVGLLLFLLANWVGQEYFSPQGFTFFLYLSALAVVIPLERIRPDGNRFALVHRGIGPTPRGGYERVVVMVFLLGTALTIVASHQLTPIMLIASLGLAAILHRSRTGWLALTSAALMLAWLAGPAWSYFRRNLLGALDTLGSPTQTSSSSVLDTSEISGGQLVVVYTDRALVLAVLALAVFGIWTRWRGGHRDFLALALLAAPAVLLLSDYEGEVLFRVYLFTTPWLALFASFGLAGVARRSPRLRQSFMRFGLVAVLLVGFLFAYLGKERFNYFTPDEVEAAEWVYENAPPNTLLIEGSRNYPGQFRRYENFFYVPIGREDVQTQARIQADPVGELERWLDNDRFSAAYLIITRSQLAEAEALATTIPGLLDDIDRALRASAAFSVAYSNDDAVVFELAEQGS